MWLAKYEFYMLMKNLKIVYNKLIPFKGYSAITLLFWMFVRKGTNISKHTINHENIHFEQEKELLFVLFYIIYCIEYIIKVIITFNHDKAYRSISFEQEAYKYMYDKQYIDNRKHYNWLKYVFSLKAVV